MNDSATITNNVHIGDEAGLLQLLIYHTNLESHDLYFNPEPKKSTNSPRVGNIIAVKQELGTSVRTTSSSCMRSSDETLKLAYAALVKEQPCPYVNNQ